MPDIVMPSLGADMDAGTIVEWSVAVGDPVKRGTVVALVETQKATMEIESFVEGRIDALLVEAGTKVPVGTPIARVAGAEETVRPPASPPPASPPPAPTPALAPRADMGRLRSSPAARKLARELSIDLSGVTGSGPHGAIVLRDIERAAHAAPPPAPPSPTPPAPAPPAPSAEAPLPRRGPPPVTGPVRDAIAAAMARSKREIPHYYLEHTISVETALASLAAVNAKRPIGERILSAAVWLRAVTRALWEVPELNGWYIDGAYRASEPVHLGTAIALRTGGVIAPAIVDADQRSLDSMMAALRDLVSRARAGRLRSSELTGATITVTSLGDRGCDAVWGVINPPQVAIIGIGSVAERPWSVGGEVRSQRVATFTLSADHRVTDGHRGARFLSELDRILQEPIAP